MGRTSRAFSIVWGGVGAPPGGGGAGSGGSGEDRRRGGKKRGAPGGGVGFGASGGGDTGGGAADTLFIGDFDITDGVTIIGAGKDDTIIEGGPRDRVFDISLALFNPGSVDISGVTIRNGEVTDESGGGIRIRSSTSLTLSDSTVTGNNAIKEGGGIANLGRGTLTIVNGTVSGNNAQFGGGGNTPEDPAVD